MRETTLNGSDRNGDHGENSLPRPAKADHGYQTAENTANTNSYLGPETVPKMPMTPIGKPRTWVRVPGVGAGRPPGGMGPKTGANDNRG